MIKKIVSFSFLLLVYFSSNAQDTAIMKLDSSWFNKDYTAAWDSMVKSHLPNLPKDSNALRFCNTISHYDLKNYLKELSSEKYEGRETGYPGQKLAEKYLATKYRLFGLKPLGDNGTYAQQFNLTEDTLISCKLEVAGKKYEHYTDFYSYLNFNRNDSVSLDKFYFAGYGIDDPKYSDYKGFDAKGAVIFIHQGEPKLNDTTYLLSGNKNASNWSNDWETKLKKASEKGVKSIFVIVQDVQADIESNHRIKGRPMRFESDTATYHYCNIYYVARKVAEEIFASAGKDYPKLEKKLIESDHPISEKLKIELKVTYQKASVKRVSSNVVGMIEGTDKKTETVVFSAHYDHLGKHDGTYYPGADDDGTGTVAVLEIAQAFTAAKRAGKGPRRNVMFILFSGEEKGLLGSEYYSEHPLVPFKNTVVDLNIDMVGRIDDAHGINPNYVYIIGDDKLSSELHEINEKANKTYHEMELDYKFNDDNDPNHYYSRSDHYNFAKKGVPVIFYFDGAQKDYHKPSDTFDKIHFGKLLFSTRLVYYTGWDIANRSERLKVDKK